MTANSTLATPSRRVTIDDAIADGKRIYVRNKFNGIVCFSLMEPNGRARSVALPKTRHPLCLNDHATPNAIQNSNEIRTLIFKGALEILTAAEAEKELELPRTRSELKAAYTSISENNEEIAKRKQEDRAERGKIATSPQESLRELFGADFKVQDTNAEIEYAGQTESNENEDGQSYSTDGNESGEAQDVDDEPMPVARTAKKTNVAPRVVALMEMLKSKEKTPNACRVELSNMIEELSDFDLDYVIKLSVGGLNEWAKAQLAERLGVNDPGLGKLMITDSDKQVIKELLDRKLNQRSYALSQQELVLITSAIRAINLHSEDEYDYCSTKLFFLLINSIAEGVCYSPAAACDHVRTFMQSLP